MYGRLCSYNQPLADATLRMTWHFDTGPVDCVVTTDTRGIGRCTRNIGLASVGRYVPMDVVWQSGATVGTTTGFTPR